MFHMAAKGKSKLKQPKEEVEHYDEHMKKSHLNMSDNKRKIFNSVLKTHTKATKFKLLMSNIG